MSAAKPSYYITIQELKTKKRTAHNCLALPPANARFQPAIDSVRDKNLFLTPTHSKYMGWPAIKPSSLQARTQFSAFPVCSSEAGVRYVLICVYLRNLRQKIWRFSYCLIYACTLYGLFFLFFQYFGFLWSGITATINISSAALLYMIPYGKRLVKHRLVFVDRGAHA